MIKITYCIALLLLCSCNRKNELKGNSYNISQTCLEANRELPLIIRDSISRGNGCLQKLKSSRYTKFYNDFTEKGNHVSFECSSDLSSGVNGVAYSSKLGDKGQSRIVLNNNIINNSTELIKTIFHELLHLDGTKHYQDIDFPYSCEFHCFEEKVKFEENVILAARDICRGKYLNPDEIEYILAMSLLFSSMKNRLYDRILELNKYMLRNLKKNRKLKLIFAQSLSQSESYFVGKYYSNLFKKYYDPKKITLSEIKILQHFEDTSIPRISVDLLAYGKLLAQKFFKLHNEGILSTEELDSLFSINQLALQYTEKDIYNDFKEMRLVLVLLANSIKKKELELTSRLK